MKKYFWLKLFMAVIYILTWNHIKGTGIDILFVALLVADYTIIPVVFLIVYRKRKIKPGEYRIKPGKEI